MGLFAGVMALLQSLLSPLALAWNHVAPIAHALSRASLTAHQEDNENYQSPTKFTSDSQSNNHHDDSPNVLPAQCSSASHDNFSIRLPKATRWATDASSRIGLKNIRAFCSILSALPNVDNTYPEDQSSSYFSPTLITVQVIKTVYEQPSFFDLYRGGSDTVRPNITIGSTLVGLRHLQLAAQLVSHLTDSATLASKISPATGSAILEDILALCNGRIPPSFISGLCDAPVLARRPSSSDNGSSLTWDARSSRQEQSASNNDNGLSGYDSLRASSSCNANISVLRRKRVYRQRRHYQRVIKHHQARHGTPVCRVSKFRPKLRPPPRPLLPGDGFALSISGEVCTPWSLLQKSRRVTNSGDNAASFPISSTRNTVNVRLLAQICGLKQSTLPILCNPDADAVAAANRAASIPRQHVQTIKGIQLHGDDFGRLLGCQSWLNDEAINGLLEVLAHDINSYAHCPEEAPKVVVIGSLAYDFFRKTPVGKLRRPLQRQRVTRQGMSETINTILVPRCQSFHWTLGVIRPKQKLIFHLDSLSSTPCPSMLSVLRGIVAGALQDQFVEQDWKSLAISSHRQNNAYDCGMFTLLNAISIAADYWPSFDASQIPRWRYSVADILLKGTFQGSTRGTILESVLPPCHQNL